MRYSTCINVPRKINGYTFLIFFCHFISEGDNLQKTVGSVVYYHVLPYQSVLLSCQQYVHHLSLHASSSYVSCVLKINITDL